MTRDSDLPSAVEFAAALSPDSLVEALGERRLRAKLLGEVSEPLRVDRFALERQLGAGGMGSVWLAFDEQLDRQVALKFLRTRSGEGADPRAERRMFREAQGLAQLSHPNVIPVFDVGQHHGRVWIAMEHVQGQTLRRWAEDRDRPLAPELVLEHWMAAGRGLAAIHRAGLVHRDVKPDNILLGDDGRVRVIDFGLVRTAQAPEPIDLEAFEETEADSAPSLVASAKGDSGQRTALTDPGGFVGTPAYAAPEQRLGHSVDARADQYSYCVALFEALCGARPPRAREQPGALVPLPDGAKLPAKLHRALSRGLELDPRRRWPDMNELLAQLERRRRWPIFAAVAGALLTGAIVGGVASSSIDTEVPTPDPCARVAEPVDAIWTEASANTLAERFGESVAATATEAIEAWAGEWRDSASESCEDVHLRGLRSPDTLDRRTACLELQLQGLELILGAVAAGELVGVPQLIAALAELERPRACLDAVVTSGARALPPAEQHDTIATVRYELGQAKLGIGDPSLRVRIDQATRARVRAVDIAWPPLIGEAELTLGRLHKQAGDADAARTHYGAALDIAEAGPDHELAAHAWSGLDRVALNLDLDREQANWAWMRLRGVVEQLGAQPRWQGRLLVERGSWHKLGGEIDEAEQSLREAVAAYEAAGPTAAWGLAGALRSLANIQRARGHEDEATRLVERARGLELGDGGNPPDAIAERSGGAALSEGLAAFAKGDHERARGIIETALADAIAEGGPRGLGAVKAHVALAAVHDAIGELEAARYHAELADAIYVEVGAVDHPRRAHVLSALGTVAFREGRHADAVTAFDRAVRIDERALEPSSPTLGLHLSNLGEALHAVGEPGRARLVLERSLAILSAARPPDHLDLAWPHKGLGAVALDLGELESARSHLAFALDRLEPSEYSLERAQTLPSLAADELEVLGGRWADEAKDIRAWNPTQSTPSHEDQRP